jgi:hypothetical protein
VYPWWSRAPTPAAMAGRTWPTSGTWQCGCLPQLDWQRASGGLAGGGAGERWWRDRGGAAAAALNQVKGGAVQGNKRVERLEWVLERRFKVSGGSGSEQRQVLVGGNGGRQRCCAREMGEGESFYSRGASGEAICASQFHYVVAVWARGCGDVRWGGEPITSGPACVNA